MWLVLTAAGLASLHGKGCWFWKAAAASTFMRSGGLSTLLCMMARNVVFYTNKVWRIAVKHTRERAAMAVSFLPPQSLYNSLVHDYYSIWFKFTAV
jgi:hypothetical protein